jgi:RNA polymerase sigma-70 factor (ECF subfamily)
MTFSPDNTWFLGQVRREHSRLRAFIGSMGVRADAVDDLAQDALLVAFEKLDTFDRAIGSDFGAWVRGIARKLVANAARKAVRRDQILSDHLTELLLKVEPAQRHPLTETAEIDRLESLNECLKKLPDHSRQIIHMHYFQEFSTGAIASRLEKTANGVRQTLFRIRQLLLECIERRIAEE